CRHLVHQVVKIGTLEVGDRFSDERDRGVGLVLWHQHERGGDAGGTKVRERVGLQVETADHDDKTLLLQQRGYHLGQRRSRRLVDNRPVVTVYDDSLTFHCGPFWCLSGREVGKSQLTVGVARDDEVG